MNSEIYKIDKVLKRGSKYLVYVNNSFNPITFTEDQIVEYRILKGNSFFAKDWNKIIESLESGKLFSCCVNYIDYKPRTEKEITKFLIDKGCCKEDIVAIIDKLKHMSLINDDRYTEFFIIEKVAREYGPKYIRLNLLDRGISIEIIEKYLSDYPDNIFYENAIDIGNKTLKKMIGFPLNKQKEAVFTRLNRLGYDYDMVQFALNKVEYSPLNNDILKDEYYKLVKKNLSPEDIFNKLLSKGYEYSDIENLLSNKAN